MHRDRFFTDTVLLVRPSRFGANPETAESNAFQNASPRQRRYAGLQAQAAEEFEAFAQALRSAGIRVYIDDARDCPSPDALFPNNWFSTHGDGTVVLYPMQSPVRRTERRIGAIQGAAEALDLRMGPVLDWSGQEAEGRYLEGTGSLVLDRAARVVYACRSPRTDERFVSAWAERFGYSPVLFDAVDAAGKAIYHTNVMMHVGSKVAVVCLEAVVPDDRARLRERLEGDGKTLLFITLPQMERFAGNMLELRAVSGTGSGDADAITVCSAQAWSTLLPEQRELLEARTRVLRPKLDAIEALGGGSARCMLGELFLPSLKSENNT